MPEGPLFAADDYGAGGGGNDYAYGDDSDYEKDAVDGNGDGGEEEENENDEEESVSNAASYSKSEFDDSDPSSLVVCLPGKRARKRKKRKVCSVATIKKNLGACDGGTNAWANAKKAVGKEPTVIFGKTEGAAAETRGRNITIRPTSNCCAATEYLLFELHNVENKASFDKIRDDADNGLYSREDFTRAIERVEYGGLKRSWETFDKCKEKWGCGAGAKSFADVCRKAKNFDDYYKLVSRRHKRGYRREWDEYYKDKYKPKK